MKIINFLRKEILGPKSSSKTYIDYLKNKGVSLGEGIEIFRPFHTDIDIQNPHLLKIGNYVQITGPVTILTHDYSWSVLKRKYGEILGNQRETIIGNNVFIGWGATILAGSKIGDNTIIGANSVVSGEVEADSVYAGNPAKRLMSLEEYYKKRKSLQLTEATNYVLNYRDKFGEIPSEEQLDEYFFLFRNNNDDNLFNNKLHLMGNYKKTLKSLRNNKPLFKSYNDFIMHVFNKK